MRRNSAILVISTTIIAGLFWAAVLFWPSFLCNCILLFKIADHDGNSGNIETPWLMEEMRKSDGDFRNPNWQVKLRTDNILEQSFGIADSFMPLFDSTYRGFSKINEHLAVSSYYDPGSGRIVFYDMVRNGKKWDTGIVRFYAGNKGVSEEPTETIGRFIDPVFASSSTLHVYDKKLRQFFLIEFEAKPIDGPDNTTQWQLEHKRFVQSEVLPEDDLNSPVRIGTSGFGDHNRYITAKWKKPQKQVTIKSKSDENRTRLELKEFDIGISHGSGQYLLVLTKNGRIDLWNRYTLKFEKTAGRLPAPRTFFYTITLAKPKNLAGYAITPLQKKSEDGYEYVGLCAASARDGWGLAAQPFDANGSLYEKKISKQPRKHKRKSYVGYWSRPAVERVFGNAGGPLVFTINFLLENLHPPVLSLASFFASDFIEADSSFRAIFIRPNSLVGMMGQKLEEETYGKFFAAIMLMMPSILLALFLAKRLWVRSRLIGCVGNNRIIWFWATVAFGIPAYIAFNLTRPKETPVTCFQCGKLRRPADPQCHWCNADWDTTAQSPPAWRIADEQNIRTEEPKEQTQPDQPTEDQAPPQGQT